MTGLFISFEGGEGSGKTTQINRLAQELVAQGRNVLTTREPGGTPEAEKIRALLVQRDGGAWCPMAEVLLLFAARIQHVEKVIKPALAEGSIVICDRFTDSTRAYQGYGHGLDLAQIEALNTLVLGDFKPDLTIVLDMDPAAGLARSTRRLTAERLDDARHEDRFESLDIAFHERLRAGFLAIARAEPARCVIVNAAQDVDQVSAQVQSVVEKRLCHPRRLA